MKCLYLQGETPPNDCKLEDQANCFVIHHSRHLTKITASKTFDNGPCRNAPPILSSRTIHATSARMRNMWYRMSNGRTWRKSGKMGLEQSVKQWPQMSVQRIVSVIAKHSVNARGAHLGNLHTRSKGKSLSYAGTLPHRGLILVFAAKTHPGLRCAPMGASHWVFRCPRVQKNNVSNVTNPTT